MKKIKYLICGLLIISLLTGCGDSSGNRARAERAARADKETTDEAERSDDSDVEIAREKTVKVPFDINAALGGLKGEITSLDVTYKIYENGAEVVNIKEESAVIQEEVEFEGAMYPVISIGDQFGTYYEKEEFEIPAHIKYINERAFASYDSLENLVIPETVEYVSGYLTFAGCGFKSITFLGEFQTDAVWESTFDWCDNLQAITVPEGVTELAATFTSCKSLESVSLPNSLETIGASAFANTDIKHMDDIIDHMPESVNTFSSRAFEECRELEELIIPDTVTSMAADGVFVEFIGMDALRVLKFPSHIDVDEYETFLINAIEAPNLELVVFPDSIEELSGDSNDYTHYFYVNLFECVENKSNLTIQVPAETVEAFQQIYPEINVVAKE